MKLKNKIISSVLALSMAMGVGFVPYAHAADASKIAAVNINALYDLEMLDENYNDKTSTDKAPDGTAYLKSITADEQIMKLSPLASTSSVISLDFRFDAEDSYMQFNRRNNKIGPFFQIKDGALKTQTGKTSFQTLYNGFTVGKWYNMELVGKMAVEGAYMDFYLYEYDGAEKTLVSTINGLHLRQFSTGANGVAEFLKLNNVSVDNAVVYKLNADTITIAADKTEINAGESLGLTASAARAEKAIDTPSLTWAVYNEDSTALIKDGSVSISATGYLTAAGTSPTQTVTVRATSAEQGNPYGEYKLKINAVDTSNDKYDTLTLTSDRNYVRVGEPLTINTLAQKGGADVSLESGDVKWSIMDASGQKDMPNKFITVDENNVLKVTDKVISQTITVCGKNESGSVTAKLVVKVKSPDMLEKDESGAKDVLVASDPCETMDTKIVNMEGSWDGSNYYNVKSGDYDFAGFGANTTEYALYGADMRFKADGAGWTIWNSNKGSQGLQVIANGTQLGVVKDSKGTNYVSGLAIDPETWYHVEIIACCGNGGNSYASMLVYKYDENGNRVNPIDGTETPIITNGIPMRNLAESSANHIAINAGTDVDNVVTAKAVPDDINVICSDESVFAGNSVTASCTLMKKGANMAATGIVWAVCDADKYPVEGDDFAIADGTMTVSPIASAQEVYIKASVGGMSAYVKITVKTSDIFEVTGIGISEDGSTIKTIHVNKAFPYNDDVTFIIAVYGADGTMKGVTVNKKYGDAVAEGESKIDMNYKLPSDFNSETDTVKVMVWTCFR